MTIKESDLPTGWFVVTTHYPHGEATGTMVEKGEARVLLMPEGTPTETLQTDEGPLPVVALGDGAAAGDLAEALRPHDLDPRVHAGD